MQTMIVAVLPETAPGAGGKEHQDWHQH